jgi:hypothetical protein
MTRHPDFDELGMEADDPERERLLRVHELLLAAGPPPEISPEIASPTLAMTLARPPRQRHRRLALLAAALATLALAFFAGYATGNKRREALPAGHTLKLVGTMLAPSAQASLQIEPVDAAGNWPMKLGVSGLPKLPPKGYYTVYLMREGKPYAPCGAFVVVAPDRAVTVWLNAPYRLRHGDWWAITKQMPGHHEPGPLVLRPPKNA